ncbi:MAG: tRNA uridine(34) 5-carboxymethylaminomethyl modification radical SAM/GNAT enzyme Elp3 [Thermoplasmatales archaeon]|nr:MAG: tRNA uridine(34) 5-carboxymethylaminomethyl modification radical SAM/GNAT enzyme Elp3 [Thermoplasmatales archaeon]
MEFYTEIIDLIFSKKIQTKEELHKAKIKLCKKYKIDRIPPDSEILAHLPSNFSNDEYTYSLLRKKPMRTISGVAIVAVMTSPWTCPHGRCIPCPGGPENNTPQSYTGYEPAAMRGSLNNFDPYLQTTSRTDQLEAIGHPTDKVDLILMGGTFTSRLPEYQEWFVKRCYDALNKEESPTLELAKKKNETAPLRCIGLTVETRPDWFRLQHVDNVLGLGTTRVELGVQSVYDDVLSKMERGHTVLDTIYATRIAKDTGLKVCYHIMPGLPSSDEKKDLRAFRMLFEDGRFKPDMIKIYPTLVIKGTKLYDIWKSGGYEALNDEKASKLIAIMKEYIPEWVRIQRIQRDVPAPMISSGVKKSNLRQFVENEMRDHEKICRCVRCREIGHKSLQKKIDFDTLDIAFTRRHYEACNGIEVFLSLEEKTQDIIIGYLRLRDVVLPHRYELKKEPCMIIRELKVLGRELSIGKRTNEALQHKGYGKELVEEAERICSEEFDKKMLFVLSGVGVKEYYRKLGYSDDGVYLSKSLKQ